MQPAGIVGTWWVGEPGRMGVRDTARIKMGLEFDPWQDGAGRLILARRADGKLACMIGGAGMSLPRQVGKTYLIAAIVFALCVMFPKLLVVWSAHHARTHGETFLAMQDFADRAKVKPYIRKVYTGSGDEEIRFRNGSRILFGARERGFGRGIPGVDVIVADEAQIMSDKALDAQLATMNVSWFGLAIFVGTPPRPDDPSEAFTRMRTEAWAGELEDSVWIELGAAPGDDPESPVTWGKANPSYPHRTPRESILRLKKKLKPESFLREGLGMWDDVGSGTGVIDLAAWKGHRGELVAPDGDVVLALDTTLDRKLSAIVAVGAVGAIPQVRVVDSRAGWTWLPQLVVRVCREHPEVAAIVIDDKKSCEPIAEAVADALTEAELDVELVRTSYPDMAEAAQVAFDLIHEGTMRHAGDAVLDAAVRAAVKDEREGAFTWSRRKAGAAVVPLIAMSLALWEWRRRVAADYEVMDSVL